MPRIFLMFVVLASAAVALAAPRTAATNPVYKSWAGFEEGAAVTYRSVTEAGGERTEERLAYTLVDLTKEKAVVERVVTQTVDGREVVNPAQRLENARTFTLPPGIDPKKFGKPEGLLESGEETVTVDGKEYRARKEKTKGRVEAGDVFTETWSSDEVPGGLLKSVSEVPSQRSTTVVELIELKIP